MKQIKQCAPVQRIALIPTIPQQIASYSWPEEKAANAAVLAVASPTVALAAAATGTGSAVVPVVAAAAGGAVSVSGAAPSAAPAAAVARAASAPAQLAHPLTTVPNQRSHFSGSSQAARCAVLSPTSRMQCFISSIFKKP